jgi:hypothetical protein
VAGGLAAAFAGPLPIAHAAPPVMSNEGVEGCPDAGDLRRAIAAHLGRDPFDDVDAPRVDVLVRGDEDGTVTAEVTLGDSSRALEGATCEDVVRAAALSVALAIERDPAPPAPPPRPEAPPPRPERAPEAERPPGPAASVRDDRFVATASGVTTVGLLPRPAPGVGVGLRLRVSDAVWLSARGLALPHAAMPNDVFAMRMFMGGAGACIEPAAWGNAALVACGHVVAGSLEVTEAREPLSTPSSALHAAATLGLGARARVFGPFSVEGGADVHLPFTRPTFLAATCPPTGFEPPFAALAVWLGGGISLP